MSYAIVIHDSMSNAILQLQKRYPNITEDVRAIAKELQENPRKGDVIPGGKGCRKVRAANSDARKGRSGGYRLLYYLVDEPSKIIHLLLIYPKSIREDVPTKEIIALLRSASLL